jgi:hypothetical protein
MTITQARRPARAARAKPGPLINRNYALLWLG